MKPVKIGDRLGRLEAIESVSAQFMLCRFRCTVCGTEASVRPSDYRAEMKAFARRGYGYDGCRVCEPGTSQKQKAAIRQIRYAETRKRQEQAIADAKRIR